MNKDHNKPLNSVSSNKNSRTITIRVPEWKLPPIRQQISRQQANFLLLVLLVGIIGGVIGGVVETVGYHGSVYTSSTLAQQKLVSPNSGIIASIAQRVEPSVVSVTATTSGTQATPDIFGFSQNPVQQVSEGTGIIISSSGLVLTNRHVVPAGTQTVSITLSNGVTLNNVSVVGRTAPTDSLDIAILKINDAQGNSLTPAVIGDSSQVNVGDSVVAIGNALGQFQNTVTSGIISGFGRNIQASANNSGSQLFSSGTSSENLSDLFQTDAAINEGNSGGPLLNLNGQVIGVNTAVATNSQNIGFAIPINDVKGLISEVVNKGKFERPFFGVRYIPVNPAVQNKFHLSVSYGAYIPKGTAGSPSVVAGSAAAKAGIKSGDVITAINGQKLSEVNNLASTIDMYEPGTTVKVTVMRGHQQLNFNVHLGVEKS